VPSLTDIIFGVMQYATLGLFVIALVAVPLSIKRSEFKHQPPTSENENGRND